MGKLSPMAEIVARFDALDAGDIAVFFCTDGTVGASVRRADIRALHTINSFTGYGETPDEAIQNLWQAALAIEGDQSIIVDAGTDGRRAYRWNGAAWKQVELPPRAGGL